MESVLGRYRNLIILVGVLFLQVLGLAVQVKRSADAEHTRLIRIWAVDMITPLERGLVAAQNSGRNLWQNYFFLRGVRAQNRELKEQIEQMRLAQVRLSEDAAQAHRLQQLLAFKEQFIAKTVPAQVIGSSGSDLSRSIYIDKGSNDNIAPDMPVITAAGIVGKVLRVYPSTSLVLMINDQSSGVGVLLEKSRLQGVLRGTANGELILERVMSDEKVAAGETVLSSGGDQIFPKGLPVGTVSKVSPGKELFLNIQMKPAADLSRLEEVLVVTEKQEREAVAEGVKVRAADILAQRLPSVPDKPATAAVPAGVAQAKAPSGVAGAGANASVRTQSNAAGKLVTGQPATGDVLKKVVRKETSVAPANNGGLGATASPAPGEASQSPTNSANPTNSAEPTNSPEKDPQAKPASIQVVAPPSQAPTQPPSEDPH